MILRALAVWGILLICAIANGGVRTALITPKFGEHIGHIISTLILCIIIFAVTRVMIRWIKPNISINAILIGTLWVSLTVAFEFLAGHYLFGTSWEKIIADYNIARGRIWILVLVTTLISPVLAARKLL
jgi:TRAP-type mannitol/chloroaromatic compound transport system permease small subunit